MITLLLLCGVLLQQPDTAEDYEQLYRVTDPHYGYSGNYTSIRHVDFKNLTVYLFDDDGKIWSTAKLKNGKFNRREKASWESLRLRAVHYVASGTNEPERAVVQFSYGGGGASSCGSEIIQVFELKSNGLVLVQNIDFGNRGDERSSWLDIQRGSLRFIASHPCDDNAWPHKLDLRFRWEGGRFRQVSRRKILTPFQ